MIKIGEQVIAQRFTEYGVAFRDDLIMECEDEADAQMTAFMAGSGHVVTREVFATAWEAKLA